MAACPAWASSKRPRRSPTGHATHVALLYANIGRSRRVNYGGDENPGTWDPWGFTSPGAAHAMMFRRHMEMYGTTTRQLAEVSVAVRHHASLNPDAVMRNPFTIDDHENARFITAPLRLLDYCLINDGAVCLILTSRERARDFAKPPVSDLRLRRAGDVQPVLDLQLRPRVLVSGGEGSRRAGVPHGRRRRTTMSMR